MGRSISPPGRLAFTEHPPCAPTGWEGATYQPVWPGRGGEPEDSTRQSAMPSFLLLYTVQVLLINTFLAHTTQSARKFKTPSFPPAFSPQIAQQSFSDVCQGQLDTGGFFLDPSTQPLYLACTRPSGKLELSPGSEVSSSTEVPERVSHSSPVLLSPPFPDMDGPSDTKQYTQINSHTLSQRQIEETGRICCFFWNSSCRRISSIHYHI